MLNKIDLKVQDYVYELRFWENTTEEQPKELAIAIPFPIKGRWMFTDKKAQAIAIALFGYVNRDEINDTETIVSLENKLIEAFGIETLLTIDECTQNFQRPFFAQLVRLTMKNMAGRKIQDYCTIQLEGMSNRDSLNAADEVLAFR